MTHHCNGTGGDQQESLPPRNLIKANLDDEDREEEKLQLGLVIRLKAFSNNSSVKAFIMILVRVKRGVVVIIKGCIYGHGHGSKVPVSD